MPADVSATDQMFQALERFRRAWPKQGWSWDGRLSTVASSFGLELASEAEAALAVAFPEHYDQRTYARAPDNVRARGDAAGGVRADQRLYAGRSLGRLVPIALWWPWGDELTISLRIGLAGAVNDPDLLRLQTQFNALD